MLHASIVALLFIELSSTQQGEVLRQPTAEVTVASEVGFGPLLFPPRVMLPSAPAVSVRVVHFPGVLAIGHAGHLSPVLCDTATLQEEHVRLQI